MLKDMCNTGEEELVMRALVYRMAQCITAGYPTRANMDIVFGDAAQEAVRRCATDAQLQAYDHHRQVYLDDPEGWVDRMRDSYTRLFIGPGKLAALPWESCYAAEGRMLFQQNALDVRAAYREQGFEPVCKNKIPDDHVSLEIGFLAELAERVSAGDEGAKEASERFLKKHLLQWLPAYACDLAQTNEGFYPDAVSFIAGFAARDVERLAA